MKDFSSRTKVVIPLEWHLLLASARLRPSVEDRRIFETVASHTGIDWDRLFQLACQNDVAPLVYHGIRETGASHVTPAVRTKLSAAYAANAMRNAILFEELGIVLRFLKSKQIKTIVLKGAGLAEIVYLNRALRPMADVDLLIAREHLFEVERFLSSLGFALHPEIRTREFEARSTGYHLAYEKRVQGLPGMCFELHWDLESPWRVFRIDVEGLWARAIPAVISGVESLVFSPEDLVLHLCMHACKHRLTAGFRAFCDIAEAVRHYEARIDWDELTARAWQWRVNTFVFVALQVSHDLLGAPIPAPVFKRLIPPAFDARLVDFAKLEILDDRLSACLFSDFFELLWGRSLGNRAAVIRKLLSAKVIAERYSLIPGQRVYPKYPLRLKYLFTSYGSELWRFLRRGRQVAAKAEGRRLLARWLEPFRTKENGHP